MFYVLFELRWPGVTCVLKRIRFTDLQQGRALTVCITLDNRKEASIIHKGWFPSEEL